MATPHTSENFGDLLDPRFQKIFEEEKPQIPSMIGTIYTDAGTNGRNNMTWSEVGTLPDIQEFTGSIVYSSSSLGYDVTLTPVEFGGGFQIQRKLYDDDQYNIMDGRPKALRTAVDRTREKHAFRLFNNAFSVDSYFMSHSEGVALCSDSHTTTSGASTASGFDNKGTASLTAVGVAAARIQMRGFRGDQAEKLDVMPDELWYPTELFEQAYEILNAAGKVDSANNNPNVHKGKYTGYECQYMNDTNNWFMCDGRLRKMYVFWSDRIAPEMAMVEDFDTLVAKWRVYGRWGSAFTNWRWIMGHNVT